MLSARRFLSFLMTLALVGGAIACRGNHSNAGSPRGDDDNQAHPAEDLPGTSLLRENFPDLLDLRDTPWHSIDVFSPVSAAFSDLGAWHAFLLANPSRKDIFGGFGGPLLHTIHYFLGPELIQIVLMDASGAPIDLSANDASSFHYLPGMLTQDLRAGDLELQIDLVFADDRTALIRYRIIAPADRGESVIVGWQGSVFPGVASLAKKPGGGVVANLNQAAYGNVQVVFPTALAVRSTIDDSALNWSARMSAPIAIDAGTQWVGYVAVPYYITADEQTEREPYLQTLLSGAAAIFGANENRWNGYIADLLPSTNKWAAAPQLHPLAVKALSTLMNNWRSAALDQMHGGVWPSAPPQNGYFAFWAWDSWKHAVILARFEPELAKDQIRAMFDYQNAVGMVPDAVRIDSTQNYWGCTKPPLASWAVQAVYEHTGDLDFVAEMFPQLMDYHRWRYAYRDHEHNGLCEYGSTDGTHQDGGNDSGMDNAARFDDAVMEPNGPGAYTFNQESVDLNSYLYQEKLFLAGFADLLDQPAIAAELRAEAATLLAAIRQKMFDPVSGYFYDIRTPDESFVNLQGPEGWTPLWTGVATPEQAAQVVKVMMDPSKFATYLPFPTLAADEPQFNPWIGYWRGMVWIDQSYFAIAALKRYGYDDEADEMTRRLFVNATGMIDTTASFRENYSPLNGNGSRGENFSWSAAHYLMLLSD